MPADEDPPRTTGRPGDPPVVAIGDDLTLASGGTADASDESDTADAPHSVYRPPFWARREPLNRELAARRTTAYIYGNILVLAALLTVPNDEVLSGTAIWVVLGTTASTFLAHSFAEAMGAGLRENVDLTFRSLFGFAKESWPVLTSGELPAVVLILGWLQVLGADAALLVAEGLVLIRLALTGIVVARLQNERSSGRLIVTLGIAAAVVGGLISLVKVFLTH